MEGIYWFRLGLVGALFLGSFYILAPTVVEVIEGDDATLSEAASSVQQSSGTTGAQLSVPLVVSEGQPAALAATLQRRLELARVSIERVVEANGGVEVRLRPGADRVQVEALATRGTSVTWYGLSLDNPVQTDIESVPATLDAALAGQMIALGIDVADWGPKLAAGVGKAPPADLSVFDASSASFAIDEGGLRASWELAESSWYLVAVDGQLRAVALPFGEPGAVRVAPIAPSFAAAADRDLLAVIGSGALPGKLDRPAAVVAAEKPSDAPVVDAAPSPVPDWLKGILPATAIARGLDLQGGIDLTLQVELEEAVLGQVARNVTQLRDLATRDNVTINAVRREKGAPTIWLDSPASMAELQDFMRKRFPEYEYSESEGAKHAFSLTAARITEIETQSVEQVLETLRKRIDATGVKEPTIVKKGGGRINIQLPGKVDMQSAVDAIGTTALLEFRLVDEDFEDATLERILLAAQDALPADQYADDMLVNDWLVDTERLAADRVVRWEYSPTVDGPRRSFAYVLKDVILTGNDVADAGVGWDQYQQPDVSLGFKPRGAQIFCDVTTANVQKRFAILLDEEVQSAPNIRERICGGRASISMAGGENPLQEANTLALVLRTGSLDAPVSVGEARQVGATLGQDAIRSGSLASLVGGSFVLVFMALWYRKAGMIANVALVLNVLLVLSALGLFGATLTLPGIAGIALTIGMAVDANIIVYERIREELRLGVNVRKAVDTGFDKALVAILDANVTTGIAGVVLYSYGSGPIKGFAVTLLIGIITTLVSALFVTRTLMDVFTRSSNARLTI